MNFSIDENYKNKILYFEKIIKDLSKRDNCIIPVFILRSQLIDFSLKYLLLNHPYNSKNIKIDNLTMGQVINEIKELKCPYMDKITKKAYDFKEFRNEITHNFIENNLNIEDIEKEIIEKLRYADEIEEEINYFFNWTEKFIFKRY